jgi:hypothetical protein
VKSSDLLAIDVAAELQTLCREQLQGSWQLPAELVRMAVARGASSVEIRQRRQGFDLRCEGTAMPAEDARRLAVAVSGHEDHDRRHQAIVELELVGAQALLWAAGMEGASLDLSCDGDPVRWSIRHRSGMPPVLEEREAGQAEGSLELGFSCRGFDRARALRWLRSATRFAPIPVRMDGQVLGGGFTLPVFELRIQQPVPARIALTRLGDAPQLWLLRHGVLATRATVPGFPAFEAAIELGAVSVTAATPGELRTAVNPFLPAIVDHAVRLMIGAADRLPDLDEQARERISCLLLRAAGRDLRGEEIRELPLLRLRGRDDRDGELVAIREFEGRLASDGGVLLSVAPERARSRGLDSPRSVLVLSTEQRALLADLLGVRVERVEDRPPPIGMRRAIAALRAAMERLQRLGLLPVGPRIVSADELLDPERVLLEELNRHAKPPAEVRLCAGGGRIRRRGRRLLLPRHNPLVLQGVRLAADDDGWLYPVVLALLADHAISTDELRARWLRRCLDRA